MLWRNKVYDFAKPGGEGRDWIRGLTAYFGVKTLRKQKFQEISITSQFSHYSIRKSKVFEISCNFLTFLFPQSFYPKANIYPTDEQFDKQLNELKKDMEYEKFDFWDVVYKMVIEITRQNMNEHKAGNS